MSKELQPRTDADSSTNVDDTSVSQPCTKPIVMCRLSEMGWSNRCDTYDTYSKKINDYEIMVHKHINSKDWQCTLVEWNENGSLSDEITINYDASFEWVVSIAELLSNGT